jgi:hypothetical protein
MLFYKKVSYHLNTYSDFIKISIKVDAVRIPDRHQSGLLRALRYSTVLVLLRESKTLC